MGNKKKGNPKLILPRRITTSFKNLQNGNGLN